jgi:outer membrane protein OmpA-like peptidoglycan-associated protein
MGRARFFFAAVFLAFSGFIANGQEAAFSSTSRIDWVNGTFISNVAYEIEFIGIPLPSGKSAIISRMKNQLPVLLKDPLLSLNVDSISTLSDLVVEQKLSLADLSRIINNAKRSPGSFSEDGNRMIINHQLELPSISSLFINHKVPYVPKTPIEQSATRSYTGIIIDARGLLPIHGEMSMAKGVPCFFPKIWDDTMELFYERNMVEVQTAAANGIVKYDYSNDESRYRNRIGSSPLRIIARQIFGINLTDPVISHADALKILATPENRKLLESGRVVILLDEDTLVHGVSVPDKNHEYYARYENLKATLVENRIPAIVARDIPRGIELAINDLRFEADSSVLLPEESSRLDSIADSLRGFIGSGYTISIEGHAASTGQPAGEQTLSTERAQAIYNELLTRGFPDTLISYRGFGSTRPIMENDTAEGRAQNRRVEIVIMPNTTYIQRSNE